MTGQLLPGHLFYYILIFIVSARFFLKNFDKIPAFSAL